MFTNKFINDEIVRLEQSISDCISTLAHLPMSIREQERKVYSIEEEKREFIREQEYESRRLNLGSPRFGSYDNILNNYDKRIELCHDAIHTYSDVLAKCENEKFKYTEEKRKRESLLQTTTEEQRAEKHYQQLLEYKRNAFTEKEFVELSTKFSEIECYKDAKALAVECKSAAKEARYKQLVLAKNEASTEAEWRDLARQFQKLIPYNDCEALATYCNDAAIEACYKQLVMTKKKASTEAEWRYLARRFQEIINYKDCEMLAAYCNDAAIEAYYKQLVRTKLTASTEAEWQYLARQFQEIINYKDCEALATYCNDAAIEARHKQQERERSEQYERIVQRMKGASTEEKYQDIAKQFREIIPYKDCEALAKECDNKSRALKEQREEQKRIYAEERERCITKKKRKRLFWKIFIAVLGGAIGGGTFALLFIINESTGSEGPHVLFIFALIIGLLIFIWRRKWHSYDDTPSSCLWGCGGSIGGLLIGGGFVALSAELPIEVVILIGIIVGALIGVWIGYKKYEYEYYV